MHRRASLTLPLFACLALAVACRVPVRAEEVTFRRDVMAVVSKAGCNAGGCHGNASGKGGFKLSLRGQDPELDWEALARDLGGRRVNVVEPENSLILLKATAQLAHEGGKRFARNSPEFEILLHWLAAGAPDSGADAPALDRLDVAVSSTVLVEPEREASLRVTAVFADGARRDVTRLAVYEPNNLLTKATAEGVITRERAGETTVLVRYLDKQVPVTLDWVPELPGWQWTDVAANNTIDELIFRKLKVLRLEPSALCSDSAFIRRAFLDLLGFVPPADSVLAFLADPSPDKRAKLIDRLLQRGEFADFWALKWADLLKIEERQLDVPGMRVFHDWIRESIAEAMPMDQFARELIAARGKTFENPPANWWRANREPVMRAENTARVFLGVQLKCAQCHNHPFERWTQDDYFNWAALFTRLDYQVPEDRRTDKNDKHEFRGDQTVFLKEHGAITNPRTGEDAVPRFLGGPVPEVTPARDELLALADWLPRTPMFARTQVNRIWFNLMGRGLVDPVDDFRASNPPSHPELLNYLAKEFAEHHFDLRHVIRLIMNSRVYQLSSEPNETNAGDETFHSRALVRRQTAEQLTDSLSEVAGAPLVIEGFLPGTRLAQVPEGRKYYKPLRTGVDQFGAAFGKPPRLIASDCERSNELAIPQAFQMISGPMLEDLLTRPGNRIDRLLAGGLSDEQLVENLFLTALSRPPGEAERSAFLSRFSGGADRLKTCEDELWALVNSKEFLFIY